MSRTDSLQGSLDLLSTSAEVLRAEEGSLYPALYRMEEEGWIRAEWVKKDTGRRARIYELTAAGKKQLVAEESRWQSVSLAINRVLREA
jgi:PadR family transcriptional regulator, regulatory protein PadR